MTALVWLLGSALVVATGAVVTFALLGRKDAATLRDVVDLLDGQRKLVAEYKHKYDTEQVAHSVTTKALDQEKTLCAIAQAQRNEAQRRVRELLGKHIATATEEEIRALTADAFSSPLSVVPLPTAEDGDRDALLDPYKSGV